MKVTFEFDLKTAVRWVLAALLIWAALPKIANLHEFQANMVAYQLPLPESLIRLASVVLPWLEFLCGMLLLTAAARRAALFWTMILFAVFVVATGQAWARGLEISCGCFKLDFLGEGLVKIFESVSFAFFRALLLLAGAVYIWRAADRLPVAKPD